MAINDILYRDEALAKREAESGMHHTMYWASVIRKLLTRADLAISNRATGMNAMNGAHYFEFQDPVTGQTYDVRIKPRMEKKPCLIDPQAATHTSGLSRLRIAIVK